MVHVFAERSVALISSVLLGGHQVVELKILGMYPQKKILGMFFSC
jgi:hypothetical protein